MVRMSSDVAPQQVVVHLDHEAPTVMELLSPWAGRPPFAVSLIATAPDPLQALDWVAAGVSAWLPTLVVEQLPGLLALAQGCHERESALRNEATALRAQFDDRKWIDRAKGLLMDVRHLSEDEAFRLLRNAAMQANLKLPEVARSVLDAARWAEAVNRAGQLRMLSQRLVALAAQRLARVDGARARHNQAMQRAQDNIAFLEGLELPEGPASRARRDAVAAWAALGAALGARSHTAALVQADLRAETLLHAAEQLTDALQALGTRATLNVINLCGRQRMRSQRLAKEALLASLLPPDPERAARMHALMTEFEQALLDIEAAPLSSPEIRGALMAAREGWLQLLRALRGNDATQLAGASEQLLQQLDRLTESCERSLQVLMS